MIKGYISFSANVSSRKKDGDEISENSDSIQSRTTDTDSGNTVEYSSMPSEALPSPDPAETLRIADEILKRTQELIEGRSSELEEGHSVDDSSSKPAVNSPTKSIAESLKTHDSSLKTKGTNDSLSKPNDTTANSKSVSVNSRPSDIPYVYSMSESSLPQLDTSRAVINRLNRAASDISASCDPTQLDHVNTIKQSSSKNSDGSFYSTTDTSTDDFYKKYIPPVSPTSSDSLASPLDHAVSPEPESEQGPHHAGGLAIESGPYDKASDIANSTLRRLANSWTEISAPANIYSLAVSDMHIWFTDKSEHIYFSAVNSPKGILWRKASGTASQISVSQNGKLVWRLHKGTAYAGTKITAKRPEGMKWVEAVRDVAFIAVDNSCAW